ncbi:hypothetical protein [Streptomyces millisiae]|uniref:Lipoprotein n=1 Tax=Streptomyces millisiae TaxID=3075542 RepID=A0ABU2LS50_9ACTN|nr:hypothetical protein [Streptomyces sp. DSM 44918]MDT0320414.1 hypothetical protein [Streptomyces sp. DSM 44918]
MRRTIRLALPAVAVATALVLAGCKSGRGGGSSSGDHSGGSSGTGGQHDDDDDFDIDIDGTTGGGTTTTTGGGSGGRNDNNTVPTNAQLEGDWYTGVDPMAANLEIEAGQVTFYEDFDVEGDVCQGVVSDGSLTLTSCEQYGTQSWNDDSATLALSGDVLQVTWASGTTMEMRNIHTPGSFTDAELAELEATIDRLNGM